MRLPEARGPLSRAVSHALRTGVHDPDAAAGFATTASLCRHPLRDGDFQLALACLYELHYRGFDDVPEEREWDPPVLVLRRALENRFEAALRAAVPADSAPGQPVEQALRALVDNDDDGTLSAYLMRDATAGQFRDFLVQRSIYQLKEADPHTWAVPRLAGAAKTALMEIQNDEYGAGRPSRAHATLFAATLRALDLDDTYGAYWGQALPETFASVNVMSYFGLHRRWRGAAVGHLAAFEMTSTSPNGRYARGLRRLGFGPEVTDYFDEHVEADAVHEQVATVDMCGALVADEPGLYDDVLWGASVCLATVGLVGAALLDRWDVAERRQGAA